jgi:hypothetical protein
MTFLYGIIESVLVVPVIISITYPSESLRSLMVGCVGLVTGDVKDLNSF